MESNLRDARQQYEAALTELRTKAGVLGAACDREAATRQQLESEVAGLTGKLEQSHSKIDELMKQNMELEKCVCTVSLASAECVCTVYAVTVVCIDLRALIGVGMQVERIGSLRRARLRKSWSCLVTENK